MDIKVTVILPSYNVFDYIEQCILSVCNQTLDGIEVLCIDAGSTDGTLEILERLANEYSEIRIIHSPVKSYGYQMNLGIREARGKYIGIVETDDYVDVDMFECLFKKAEESQADMVKGVLYEVYASENGKEKEIQIDYMADKFISDADFSPDDEPDVHDWDGNIWNGIYRKSFLTDNNIFFQETPGAAFQDIAFQQLVLNEANKVAYIHSHFYHYRRLRKGASTWNPKCLRYIYDAYKYLLANDRIKEKNRRFIYKRLSHSFLYELRKALCMSEYSLARLECQEGVDWYIKEMKQALHAGAFRFDDLLPDDREEVTLFFADIEQYIACLKERTEALYAWMEQLKESVGDRKLIVFGAGQYGNMLIAFLIKNGIWIDGIADNQKCLNETSYFGMRVSSARDVSRDVNNFYLVANKKSGNQIKTQLINYGISENRIMIFDGTDKNLLSGIKKCPILPRREIVDI